MTQVWGQQLHARFLLACENAFTRGGPSTNWVSVTLLGVGVVTASRWTRPCCTFQGHQPPRDPGSGACPAHHRWVAFPFSGGCPAKGWHGPHPPCSILSEQTYPLLAGRLAGPRGDDHDGCREELQQQQQDQVEIDLRNENACLKAGFPHVYPVTVADPHTDSDASSQLWVTSSVQAQGTSRHTTPVTVLLVLNHSSLEGWAWPSGCGLPAPALNLTWRFPLLSIYS